MELLYVYIFFLNLIYFVFKLLPVNKNKILFLSRQTNSPSIDYRMLIDELKKQNKNIKVVTITKRIEKKKFEFILKNFTIIFRQMYHLATCKVCIIDGYNIPISVLKHKKNLTIFQIWHSLGAIKKFGYQIINSRTDEKIAKIMSMHKNYDQIITSSKEMNMSLMEAFNYKEEKFKVIGLPRIDYLIKNKEINKNKIYEKYPNLKEKETIIYAPTFRKSNNYKIDELIESIDKDKYNLIVKKHDCMKLINNNIFTCDDFTTLQLLSVADYVITDYSAVCLEAAILNIPTYFYIYDFEEYKNNTGLNIDIRKEMKNSCYIDAKTLFKDIDKKNYKMNELINFKKKYLPNNMKNITKRLATYILKRGGINEIESNTS